MDEHQNMTTQINTICRSAHFHLRNIRSIRSLLPSPAAAQLVHSLITSRIDYCNSLLYGLPDNRRYPLQRIQNIAARIVSLRSDRHITPILRDLHWLPIKFRIIFKILLLTYKCVHGLAPNYLSNLIPMYHQNRNLRSTHQRRLETPKTRLKTYGDRSFSFAAPKEWNKLPLHIKISPSVDCFKSQLKTYLFKQHFG